MPFLLFPLPLIQTCSWLNNKIVWLVTSPSDRRFSEELRCPARSVENTDGPIKASALPAEPLASDKSAPRWLRQRLYFKQALHSRPALKFFPVSSHPVLSSNHLITMHLMEELKGKHKCQRCRAPWPQWQEFGLWARQGSGFAPNLSTVCPYELTWSAGKEQTRSVSCFDSYPREFSLTVLFPLPFAENTAVLPDAPRAVSRKEAVCTSSSSSQAHSCCTSNIYL